MKKVGIFAFVEKSQGGVYQYLLSNIQALAATRNYAYTIFTYTENIDFDDFGFSVVKLRKTKIEKMAGPFSLLFRSLNPLLPLYSGLFKEIDIILSPVLCNHLYLTKRKFIFTLHDLQEKYYPEFFTLKQRIGRHIRNVSLIKMASRIICESHYVKKDIIKYLGANPEKISVLHAPPSVTFNKTEYSVAELLTIRSKYHLPASYIYYPAQFWHHKNHEKLLHAFKIVTNRIDDIHLVFSGAKQNSYDNVMRKIYDLSMEDKVHYIGYIDAADVAAIYKMSKMLVMPSLYESISIPIYEAFSIGIPVCASNVFALPEQMGGAGLLFNPHDINDISAAIYQLLTNGHMRRDLVERASLIMKSMTHRGYGLQLESIIEAELTSG
jgi:glycosyltransferase involved in cell wall biosynthesis